MIKSCKRWLPAVLATTLAMGFVVTTSGCGAEKVDERTAAPPSNVPPGGGSADEYARKMAEMQGKSRPTGSPPGPGSAVPPGPPR